MRDEFDGDDDTDIHVMPCGDLREHDVTTQCWCRPVRDAEQIEVVIHNSLDGRERLLESGYIN